MSSLKIRKLDVSKSESLLATVGSAAMQHRTTSIFTVNNGLKVVRAIVIATEFVFLFLLWCLYMSKTQTEVMTQYLFQSSLLTLSYMDAYYWMQNIVQATMIVLCMIFFIEFILYTDDDWIHEVKKARDGPKIKLINAQSQLSHSQYGGAQVSPNRKRKNKLKRAFTNNDCSICVKLCSFTFCCRRIGAAIVNIFTVTWSELHVLCMITCIYYILSVMLRIYHSKIRSPKSLFIINDALTAFGIILPPFAYSLCAKLEIIYDSGDVSDETVAGSVWEKDKGKHRWYRSSSQMSILQASKSILNDTFVKIWMFLMYLLQLIIFITEPITCHDKFRYFLNTMYDCWKQEPYIYTCDPTTSQIVFTVHILVLRVAVPLLLLNTLYSFTPRSSQTAQIMHYTNFHSILTPSAIIIIVLNAFLSNYFLFHHYSVVTWGYTLILLCFSIWQIFIFIQSLRLAESAEDDQQQFHGYATRNKASLCNYFSKGILLLILWSASFVCLMLCKSSGRLSEIKQNQILRQIPSILFSTTSMVLLIPLQKVAISPTYRDYFRRKNRIKYLVTFHIICLLCIVFMVQKFILILSFYFEIITDERNMKNAAFATSFGLSFASIGFHIWLFGKYSGILYPIVPKMGHNDDESMRVSMTQMSQVYGRKKRESRERKDSKMSLTALYQNRRRTPSIPTEYEADEESNYSINGVNRVQKRTRSLCSKTRAHKHSIESDQSAKATSVSQRKLQQMAITEYDEDKMQDIETWNDAARIYGLKSLKSENVYNVEQIVSFAVDPDNSKRKLNDLSDFN